MAAGRPSPLGVTLIVAAGVLSAALLAGLGVWQVERLVWKLDLIGRVESRVDAEPVAAPAPPAWAEVARDSAEYRKVSVSGHFLPAEGAFVQAVTELGAGFWLLVPLRTDGGFTVLVNRGFVPPPQRASVTTATPTEKITVTGLLRMTEPGGGFLRDNDPGADRWYSRDVAAIADAKGLGETAPYFIDADATPNPGGWPVGGLTVTSFANNHLVYALTWFGLAAMALAGGCYVAYDWRRRYATRSSFPRGEEEVTF